MVPCLLLSIDFQVISKILRRINTINIFKIFNCHIKEPKKILLSVILVSEKKTCSISRPFQVTIFLSIFCEQKSYCHSDRRKFNTPSVHPWLVPQLKRNIGNNNWIPLLWLIARFVTESRSELIFESNRACSLFPM